MLHTNHAPAVARRLKNHWSEVIFSERQVFCHIEVEENDRIVFRDKGTYLASDPINYMFTICLNSLPRSYNHKKLDGELGEV